MDEKEYIEREAALNEMLQEMAGTGYQSRAMDVIRYAPAADVVEVVRCKDCKHRNPNGWKCLRDNLWHNKDDFCSYGEREEQT